MIPNGRIIPILIALASAGTLEAQAGTGGLVGTPTRTIFEGATVIDGTGAAARADMAVVVEGEWITAVVPAGELGEEVRDGAGVVDASRWFAIPGLVESHTHVATQADRARAEFILNRQLYAGITTARDMAGDVRSLMDLQRASLVKEIAAPDLHFSALMAGPDFFTDPRTVSSAAGETPGSVSWMQAVTQETEVADAVALARRAWEAGVMVAAGTDGMTPPASDFPALHDEIRLLHEEVGMPMMDVLKAATYHGAVALGMEDAIGTIEPGKKANIVFLREDPLAGPESLRSVDLTVKRGTLYYRRDFVLGAPPAP